MLTSVSVTNVRGNVLQLPLLDSSAGYVVEDIEGLGPVNATLTSSSIAQLDGATFQNAQRGTRNITSTIGFAPDFVNNTVQSLRSNLYDYFLPKANVDLAFYMDGDLYALTSGQVESFDGTLFSNDPSMDLSIICYDPDFYAPDSTVISGDTVSTTDTQIITYPGTTDAGFIFTLNVNRSVDGFSLYNTRPDGIIQVLNMISSLDLVNGDVVTITSIPGSKSIVYNHAGTPVSGLAFMDPTSDWPLLTKGDNVFRAYASGDPIPFTIEYTTKYGAL